MASKVIEREYNGDISEALAEFTDTIRDQYRTQSHQDGPAQSAALITDWYERSPDGTEIQASFKELHDALGLYDRSRDEGPPVKKKFGEHEDTMIELIVSIISHPLAANKLNKDSLDRLRKALLDPAETGKLKQDLLGLSYCTQCMRQLSTREMLTLYDGEDPRKNSKVYCVKCLPPAAVPCNNTECTEVVPFSRGHALRDHYCANHRAQIPDPMVLHEMIEGDPRLRANVAPRARR
jgi:hypothetical protein